LQGSECGAAAKGRGISKICCDTRCLHTAKPEIHAEIGLPADFVVVQQPPRH
jgi:hypothetical protein